MTTAGQVLARAASQLGVKEFPAGSNHVVYCDWYGMTGPWCAMFVSWCTYLEGLALKATTAKGFAYAPSGAHWFQRNGAWSEHPSPGHVVFYNFAGDDIDRISHCGLVERIDPDGTLVTLEGNTDDAGGTTGGQVMRRRRRVGIVGYGVPAYGTAAGATAAPPYTGLLRRGSTGTQVRVLQARLVQLHVAQLGVDGAFGAQTEAAVRHFQASHGLTADGVVGPVTWAALW
jgi:Putative peptidoglycan binding domain/CHAP domain